MYVCISQVILQCDYTDVLMNVVTGNKLFCFYVVMLLGLYQIHVAYEGMLIPGSPFTFCVFDPQAITVCPIDPVACNELVEFTGKFAVFCIGFLSLN